MKDQFCEVPRENEVVVPQDICFVCSRNECDDETIVKSSSKDGSYVAPRYGTAEVGVPFYGRPLGILLGKMKFRLPIHKTCHQQMKLQKHKRLIFITVFYFVPVGILFALFLKNYSVNDILSAISILAFCFWTIIGLVIILKQNNKAPLLIEFEHATEVIYIRIQNEEYAEEFSKLNSTRMRPYSLYETLTT